jgi:general secretion pathway protein A
MPGGVQPNAVSPGQAEAEPTADGGRRPHAAPFQAGKNPELLWLGRRHQEILDQLASGVLGQGGVLLLTGEVGTGKTILAKALLDRLRPDTLIARMNYGQHDSLDFSREISQAWGVGDPAATREEFYTRLPAFLDEAAARGKGVLLFVDEAQTLSQDQFTEIGHLAIVAEEAGQTPLSILLVGQDSLGTILARPENARLAKRITVRCVTAPLTSAEVREYVAHQLKVAGGGRPEFTEDALREIASTSLGVPGLINTIADLALLRGMRRCAPAIGAETVRKSARTLGHPVDRIDRRRSRRARVRTRTSPGFPPPGRQAAVYVPILAVLLSSGGYLYLSNAARDRDVGPISESSPLPAVSPSPNGPAGQSVGKITPPAPATDAAPSEATRPEPRAPEAPPPPPSLERLPARHAVSAPQPPFVPSVQPPAPSQLPSLPPVRPPAPPVAPVAEERREMPDVGAPAASRNQESPPAALADTTRRTREVRTSEASDTVDPAGIIDWLLSEYPARRQ